MCQSIMLFVKQILESNLARCSTFLLLTQAKDWTSDISPVKLLFIQLRLYSPNIITILKISQFLFSQHGPNTLSYDYYNRASVAL